MHPDDGNEILSSLQYDELARRHEHSTSELKNLRAIADRHWHDLASKGGDRLGIPNISERACIYVTGSLARLEATQGSDLDLFVLDSLEHTSVGLTYVENAHLISTLDQIRLEAGFRPFSRGGQFIHTHSLRDVVTQTGSPDDDAKNTFTARILLLLNSFPLLNEHAYAAARSAVLDRYWQTSDPEKNAHPIMLTNDIRRWWGVVGLNFEMYNPKSLVPGTDNFITNPKREVANMKLRYARMLACYSAILGLLHESAPDGLHRSQVERILDATPIERLTYVAAASPSDEARKLVDRVLREYDNYLLFMSRSDKELLGYFKSAERRRSIKAQAYEFHAIMARLVRRVGEGKVLLDYVII